MIEHSTPTIDTAAHDDGSDEPCTLVIADIRQILAEIDAMTPEQLEALNARIWDDE